MGSTPLPGLCFERGALEVGGPKLGQRIARLRNERRLTQEQLLERLRDKDIENYRKIEKGLRNVTIKRLVEIADALEVPLRALFAEEDT